MADLYEHYRRLLGGLTLGEYGQKLQDSLEQYMRPPATTGLKIGNQVADQIESLPSHQSDYWQQFWKPNTGERITSATFTPQPPGVLGSTSPGLSNRDIQIAPNGDKAETTWAAAHEAMHARGYGHTGFVQQDRPNLMNDTTIPRDQALTLMKRWGVENPEQELLRVGANNEVVSSSFHHRQDFGDIPKDLSPRSPWDANQSPVSDKDQETYLDQLRAKDTFAAPK